MTEMTLQNAIAEVKRATNYGPWQVGDIGGQQHNPLAHEIVFILNAAASGDMIPKADADLAVALALREAADACKYLHVIKTQDRHGPWNSAVLQCCELILALAPADALAEVEKLRAMLQIAEANTSLNASISAANLARAEAAEAEVGKLKAERDALLHALQWCSGSEDFQDGGFAREGWLKLCAPLLHNAALTTPEKDATP